MQTITEPRAMQAWADATRGHSERIALVPTMGALHEGHVALIAEARRRARRVVVSIFVNPIQFDRRDDFERYPRTLEDDAARCAAAGVDVVFAPSARVMYPEGFQTAVAVRALTVPLCGKTRPGHFRGVTTVVTKLFHAVRPHLAVFGEKDWQQLAVVRRMAADLDFGIEIVGVPTVREADGLALSSRNRRLSAEERKAARCVPRALDAAAEMVATGETRPAMIVGRVAMEIAACPHARLEYAEVRDPETLEEVEEVTSPALLGLAVWVGDVRLIDNRLLVPAEAERGSPRLARAAASSGGQQP
jgi:pantoate--beta-alanine ligase